MEDARSIPKGKAAGEEGWTRFAEIGA